MRAYRLFTLLLAALLVSLPVGAGELRHAIHTALNPSLLTQYQESERPSVAEDIVTRATDAVVLVSAYEEVPVYSRTYARLGAEVWVTSEQVGVLQHLVSSGSAFLVSEDGYLITNNHVVAYPDALYYISTGEGEYDARVVYRDPGHDIAVLKIEGQDFPFLSFAEGIRPGEPVIAIGNALGTYVDSVSVGTVLSLGENIIATNRSGSMIEALTGVIETSAKLYPGDSGGPLLNERGEVVGIGVATTVGEQVGYAVPAAKAKVALMAARGAGI